MAQTDDVLERWRRVWPQALDVWSTYTLLREPRFFDSNDAAAPYGMAGQLAAIRLRDQTVMVNVAEICSLGLEDYALAILAHEVGHHVYVPGNLTDNARMIGAMSRLLIGLPSRIVHVVANLYGDLMINDRLQRRAEVDVASVYGKLREHARGGGTSSVWSVYTRTYEHLWRLEAGSIAPLGVDEEMDADALLLARIIRNFAGDWLRGARRFATVLYRYLAADQARASGNPFEKMGLHDTKNASSAVPGEECVIPDGLATLDPAELEDDDLDDLDAPLASPTQPPEDSGANRPAGTQYRQPFEYGALLEALGLPLDEAEVTSRYYKERALPHLIPFPNRRAPRGVEPLAEGHEDWAAGDPIEALDLFGSVMRSPHLVPGVTTVQRVYGEAPGEDPARVPLDLDIYIDCSGSMPNPARSVSYLALCGTILALSALRAGARVQATLWSSPGVFDTTGGFIRDERAVLRMVTGYVSGATAFPLHLLRDTYEDRRPSDPPAHIVVISDDGCDTMLSHDEKGNPGATIIADALARARGGGTLVLNLFALASWHPKEIFEEIGYRVHAVSAWEDLVAFARAFVLDNYGDRS